MRKLITILILAAITATGCSSGIQKLKNWKNTMLFDGKSMTGWEFYLEDKSIDPADVWFVKEYPIEDSKRTEKVLHCTGTPNGYMRTTGWYDNYQLHLEWRWVDAPGNSGVMLHVTGNDKLWPRNIECQLQAGNAGDFWLIGGPAMTADGKVVSSEQGYARIIKQQPSNEVPVGQWNSYDIYCDGDTLTCYVNGEKQNEGINLTDSSGRIGLQSEGAAIEFRNIYIKPIR